MDYATYQFEEIALTLGNTTFLATGFFDIKFSVASGDTSVGESRNWTDWDLDSSIVAILTDEDGEEFGELTIEPGEPLARELIRTIGEDRIVSFAEEY